MSPFRGAAGASVDSYYLGDYNPAAIKPPGQLTVLSMSAAQSGGRLRGAFRLLLPNSTADLSAQPLSVLTAGAGLTSAGGLIPHHANQARRHRVLGYTFGTKWPYQVHVYYGSGLLCKRLPELPGMEQPPMYACRLQCKLARAVGSKALPPLLQGYQFGLDLKGAASNVAAPARAPAENNAAAPAPTGSNIAAAPAPATLARRRLQASACPNLA